MTAVPGNRVRWSTTLACALAGLLALPALPAHSALAAPPAPAKHGKKKHGPKHKPKTQTVAQKKKPPPPPPLDGASYDYDYNGGEGHPERRWMGRVFVHKKAAATPERSLPVVVFLHGNNNEKIKYRWMGGGQEGDVRRVVSEMIEAGQIPPVLVAAPSSIDPNTMGSAGFSWPAFDLDLFLDRTEERLGGAASIDRGRVVVTGHSGAGCNIRGGLNTALHAQQTPVLAGFVIDTCMMLDLAKDLAHVRPTTHLVVSWQSISWPEREFGAFKTMFNREVKKTTPAAGVLRELDYEQPNVPGVHDAMVGITLRKWLPRVLGAGTPPVTPDAPEAGVDPPTVKDGGAPDG